MCEIADNCRIKIHNFVITQLWDKKLPLQWYSVMILSKNSEEKSQNWAILNSNCEVQSCNCVIFTQTSRIKCHNFMISIYIQLWGKKYSLLTGICRIKCHDWY